MIETINEMIAARGGLVNAQAHLYDKGTRDGVPMDTLYDQMTRRVEAMAAQGITTIGSVVEMNGKGADSLLAASRKLQETFSGQMNIQLIGVPSEGIVRPEAYVELRRRAAEVDVIGGDPSVDASGRVRHITNILDLGIREKKPVAMHLSDSTFQTEDLQVLAREVIDRNLQGRIVTSGVGLLDYLSMKDLLRQMNAQVVSQQAEITQNLKSGLSLSLGTNGRRDFDYRVSARMVLANCRKTDNLDIGAAVDILTVNGRRAVGLLQ